MTAVNEISFTRNCSSRSFYRNTDNVNHIRVYRNTVCVVLVPLDKFVRNRLFWILKVKTRFDYFVNRVLLRKNQ